MSSAKQWAYLAVAIVLTYIFMQGLFRLVAL